MNFFSLISIFLFSLFIPKSFAIDLEQIKKNQMIKIAVDTTYPPMEFESIEGKVIGLDVELAEELAKRLGVKAEFVVMPWDGILAGLKSNRYDIIMSSMNITDERKKEVNFVEYLKMGQVFVHKKIAPKISNEKELAGKVIAVQADTTSFEAVESYIKKGIKIKEVKAFKGATDAFSALKSNQAEAIVIDEAVGKYYASLDAKTFTISGTAIKPEPIGIAVKKSSPKLLTAIQKIIQDMKNDGSIQKIYFKWLKSNPEF